MERLLTCFRLWNNSFKGFTLIGENREISVSKKFSKKSLDVVRGFLFQYGVVWEFGC